MLVAYFSETGNTERVARAVSDAVTSEGHEVELEAASALTPSRLGEYDLIFLGSACHSSTLAEPVLALLSSIRPGAGHRLAGFATHSAPLPEGGEADKKLYEAWASGCPESFEEASRDGRIELLGYFGCQGAPSPPIEDFIHRTILPNEREWQSFLENVRKHPDASDLEEAGAFARRVLEAYSKLGV